MSEKGVDRPPSSFLVQEDLDTILYSTPRCCQTESYRFNGGYRREIFRKNDTTIVSLFNCAHCKHILRDPWQLKDSGTQYCGECMDHILTFHSPPFQKADAFEDLGSKSKLSRIIILCPLAERGCKWRGQLTQVREHLRNCGLIRVQCMNEGCRVVKIRAQVLIHQMKECPSRLVQCNHCQLKFKAALGEKHMKSECEKSIVLCPYKCDSKMERGKLRAHLDANCPNVIVRCPFYKYGCVNELPRREIGKHLSSSNQHMSLFTQRFEAYEKDIQGLSVRNEMLLDKIRDLEDTDSAELFIQNRCLQIENNILKWRMELLTLINEYDNTSKNSFFICRIANFRDIIQNSGVFKSKPFTSEHDMKFCIELTIIPHSHDNNEGFIKVEVYYINPLENAFLYIKGDAVITFLNQVSNEDHYSYSLTLNNLNHLTHQSDYIPITNGCNQVPSENFIYKEKFIQNDSLIFKFKLGKLVYSPNPLSLD